MPDANFDWAPIIMALATLITAIAGAIQAAKAKTLAGEAKDQAQQTHLSVNSRMDELLKLTRTQAGAEATLAEKSAQAGREGAAAIAIAAKPPAPPQPVKIVDQDQPVPVEISKKEK